MDDRIEFDDLELPLAESAGRETPRPEVKARLMERIRSAAPDRAAAAPRGFSFTIDADTDWQPHRCRASG
ncbi:MAG: hypothetical protein R2712_03945 [Vicinamibacterales bacterium]